MTLDEVLTQMKKRTNLGINRYGTTLVRESTMRAWTDALESVKNTTLNSDYEKCSHELLDKLLGNYNSEQHAEIILILKKHFA